MPLLLNSPFTITGIGGATGDLTRPNSWFEEHLDTTDEWIVNACGVKERKVGGTTSALGAAAAKAAIADAGVAMEDIDVLVLATSSPEYVTPANATVIHRELGLRAGCVAFDISCGCAGFVVALTVAQGWLANGARNVLVVGSDTIFDFCDQTDRRTAILFGNGAGAVVVSREGDGQMLSVDMGTDSSGLDHLTIPYGGTVRMNGQEVFRRAVTAVSNSVRDTITALDVEPGDVDLLVPHQANTRITAAVTRAVGLDPSRVLQHLSHVGNTSAGSVPLTLRAHRDRLKPGQLVILTAFGAGISYATVALRWG